MATARLAGAALAGAALGAAYAGLVEPRRIKVRRLSFALPDWPAGLDGLRIAVVSDLHAGGPHVDEDRIEEIVARVNGEHPDLVALLGDYVDPQVAFGGEVAPAEVADRLADLRAQLGVFAVLGNHDWAHDGEGMRRHLRGWGVEVLENDAAQVQHRGAVLWIVGLADATMRRPDTETPFALVPEGAPLVVLTHDPDVFPHLPSAAALTLAGHTHGGQLNLPLLKKRIIPSRHGDRYDGGPVKEDGRQMYVSRGLGESRWPIRAGVPPEIAILKLTSEEQH